MSPHGSHYSSGLRREKRMVHFTAAVDLLAGSVQEEDLEGRRGCREGGRDDSQERMKWMRWGRTMAPVFSRSGQGGQGGSAVQVKRLHRAFCLCALQASPSRPSQFNSTLPEHSSVRSALQEVDLCCSCLLLFSPKVSSAVC